MIVGMIPMAIGGAGEEQNAALARAVIGGLLFATPTTLLIVPYLFARCAKAMTARERMACSRSCQMNEMVPFKPDDEIKADDRKAPSPRGWLGGLFGLAVLLLLVGGLAFGAWRYYAQQQATASDTEQRQTLVPTVRTATVKAGSPTVSTSLPGTTAAFATANIFARASGYIAKRYVDIGDRVKAGQVLAEITAPEIDHQIAQAEATLNQSEATLRQQQANAELAAVTWARDKPLVDKGWVTLQQGDVDRQNLEAQQAAVGVAQSNVAAQQAQIKVLQQSKDYLSVLAPFDGVITRRNIDVGSLVQADATTGTFMFTVMQTNVIRTQVYVPQDQAFGVVPGVEARGARSRAAGQGLRRPGDAHRRCARSSDEDAAHRDRCA